MGSSDGTDGPEKTLDFLNDPDRNLRFNMKGGYVHKNTIQQKKCDL
jgi:hypothetical protein